MKIYLSFPMSGQNFNDLEDYVALAKAELRCYGYEVLHPLTATSYLRDQTIAHSGYLEPEATDRAIFSRDKAFVQLADIVYVNNMGFEKLSTGCTFELAWAEMLNKQVILACEHEQHAFIKQSVGIQFETHMKAMLYLEKLRYGTV